MFMAGMRLMSEEEPVLDWWNSWLQIIMKKQFACGLLFKHLVRNERRKRNRKKEKQVYMKCNEVKGGRAPSEYRSARDGTNGHITTACPCPKLLLWIGNYPAKMLAEELQAWVQETTKKGKEVPDLLSFRRNRLVQLFHEFRLYLV